MSENAINVVSYYINVTLNDKRTFSIQTTNAAGTGMTATHKLTAFVMNSIHFVLKEYKYNIASRVHFLQHFVQTDSVIFLPSSPIWTEVI